MASNSKKISNHPNLNRENVNASQNRGAIKKTYDVKPSTSKTASNTKKAQKTTRRIESINKPQETYLQVNAQLQKQRLLELHKKSLEIVSKNVQAKRERSKSRDGTVPTRPARYRSLSQERNSVSNSRSRVTKEESGERSGAAEQRNPNLLYPPLPNYVTRQQKSFSETSKTEDVTQTPNKESSILNKSNMEKVGNVSKRKAKSPIDTNRKLLKPINLFNLDPIAGESDMSRNTSENRASLRKTEPAKQSNSPGIKIISNITLVPPCVESGTSESEDVQHYLKAQPTSHESQPRKRSSRSNLVVESLCTTDLSFESNLSRSRESILTYNSPTYNKVFIRSPNSNFLPDVCEGAKSAPEPACDHGKLTSVVTGTNKEIGTRPGASNVDIIAKSKSRLPRELQNINTRRGTDKSSSVWRLSEATVSQSVADREPKSKLKKNITLRSDWNLIPKDLHGTNELHLKFEAEIHHLNHFNESLLQLSAEEEAGESKNTQNQYTQTSLGSNYVKGNVSTGANSELSINFSRGSFIDVDLSSLDLNKLPGLEISELNTSTSSVVRSRLDVSNIENLHSKNFAGMSLRMFEQLIKDEDVRLENLKTILKIREHALLDRVRGELAWLEIQRKHLGETDQLQKASLIKKKQRAVLVNLQKEKHEMQRLKQMQQAASLERKIILKEQRSLIKHQLHSNNMLAKIRLHAPRERRLSAPLKVVQSHSDSSAKTSISLRSSTDTDQEFYSAISHVSTVSEVSGDGVGSRDVHSDVVALNLASRSEKRGMPISQLKQTLLMREAALQKRRKAAEDLLQWHKKLLEEEKHITELESAASAVLSNASTSVDVGNKYLNRLWLNLTGCEEEKFIGDQTYPMSQVELKRFHRGALQRSKTKVSENISDALGKCPTISEIPPTAPPEVVSEDIDKVDQNINRLIDDFTKAKEDISSLSSKQCIKAGQNREHDRSEKPAFAEANRTSKEQEEVSKDNINMCNNTASAVVEVKDNLGETKAETLSEAERKSKENDGPTRSKQILLELSTTEDRINTEVDKEDLQGDDLIATGKISERLSQLEDDISASIIEENLVSSKKVPLVESGIVNSSPQAVVNLHPVEANTEGKEYEAMLKMSAIEENETQSVIDEAKEERRKSLEVLNHAEKVVGFPSSEKVSLESLEEPDGKVDIEIIVIEDEETAAEIIEINEPHKLNKKSEEQSKFVNSINTFDTGEDFVLSSRILEGKLPRNDAGHIKTRVSEILAHSKQSSWGNNSPRLQDLYTTTYDVVASMNCEELGTPIKEVELTAAKSIFGTEAEIILKKQLAIEREIKQITQQQSPCLFVREIPNKPPPPYVPPPSPAPLNVTTIVPTKDEIEEISKYSAEILHKAHLSHNLDNISITENTLGLISKNITKECYKFVFDLCKEFSQEHYKQFEQETCPSWLQVTKKPQLTAVKPLDVVGLEKHLNKNLKELFGYEKPVRREKAVIKWSRKNRDHVDKILVMESQRENAQWTNFDKDKLLVMNDVTNKIMNTLLDETAQIFTKLYQK